MKTITFALITALSLTPCFALAGGNYDNKHNSSSKSSSSKSSSSDNTQSYWDKLFTAQVKISEYQPFGSNISDDIFLRKGSGTDGHSANVDWQEYDTNSYLLDYNASFSWMLTRQGNMAEFTFGDTTVSYETEDGTWEGVGLYFDTTDNKGWLYDHAWLNVTIDEWNEDPLQKSVSYTSTLGNDYYFEVYNSDLKEIESISGTITVDWELSYWSKYFHVNPEDNFSLWFKGLDYNHIDFDAAEESSEEALSFSNSSVAQVNSPPLVLLMLSTLTLAAFRKRKLKLQK
jgi:hypothetical protein